jgi:predicted amidohydrolase YtcJ
LAAQDAINEALKKVCDLGVPVLFHDNGDGAIDARLRATNRKDFVVAPLDPMMMVWPAVNRISRASAEIGPDKRIDSLEGLKTTTISAAEPCGEKRSKGSLEPGKLADMVILDKNPPEGRAHRDQGHPGRRDDQGR